MKSETDEVEHHEHTMNATDKRLRIASRCLVGSVCIFSFIAYLLLYATGFIKIEDDPAFYIGFTLFVIAIGGYRLLGIDFSIFSFLD